MKSIKKILAAVMATAVVGAACMVPVSAYDTTATFSVEQKTITLEEAAGEVTIELTLDNDTVVNATAFQFTWDSGITLTKMVAGSGISAVTDDGGINASAPNKSNGKFALACTPGDTVKGAVGQIVKLTFTVDNPKAGDKYNITCTNINDVVQEVETGNKVVLDSTFNAGYIEIEDVTTTTPAATTTPVATTTPTPTTTPVATTTPTPTTTPVATTTPTPTTTPVATTTPTPTTTPVATTTPPITTTGSGTTTTDGDGDGSVTTTTAGSGNNDNDGSGTTTAGSGNGNTTTTTAKGSSGKSASSPSTGDTSSAAGIVAVLALAGAAAVATKKIKK
jgi:LPXTG-motif cell wall-anchored protein